MVPQSIARRCSLDSQKRDVRAWSGLTADYTNPALLERSGEVRGSEPIFGIGWSGDSDSVCGQRRRTIYAQLSRLGNEAEVRLSREARDKATEARGEEQRGFHGGNGALRSAPSATLLSLNGWGQSFASAVPPYQSLTRGASSAKVRGLEGRSLSLTPSHCNADSRSRKIRKLSGSRSPISPYIRAIP